MESSFDLIYEEFFNQNEKTREAEEALLSTKVDSLYQKNEDKVIGLLEQIQFELRAEGPMFQAEIQPSTDALLYMKEFYPFLVMIDAGQLDTARALCLIYCFAARYTSIQSLIETYKKLSKECKTLLEMDIYNTDIVNQDKIDGVFSTLKNLQERLEFIKENALQEDVIRAFNAKDAKIIFSNACNAWGAKGFISISNAYHIVNSKNSKANNIAEYITKSVMRRK